MRCRTCGRKIQKAVCTEFCSSECFHRDFWQSVLKTGIIVNRECYQIADENSLSSFRCFGGKKFIFEMKDTGERIVSTNVWHNGTVPEEMYTGDNAVIVKEG